MLPLRLGVALLFEVFRVNFVCTVVDVAMATLEPSLFRIPLWGPLICGSMAGSFGQFLPFDKGLSPIVSGFNWVMMSAFTTAASYMALVHVPETRELLWRGQEVSPDLARLSLFAFLLSGTVGMELGLGHPLQPVTRLLSLVVAPVLPEEKQEPKVKFT